MLVVENGSVLVRPPSLKASSLIARARMWLMGQRIGRASSWNRNVVLYTLVNLRQNAIRKKKCTA
jgi:hypothetical protein